MAKLQKTFKFGEWKSIYNSEGDYAGRAVIQDQSYGFHVRQAKFVRERLSPVVIPKRRPSDKKSETSDGEKRQLRAVWSSVNWVQRETRPDVSALASLGMGSLNQSTVQDLCDANAAVERLKAELFLGIKLSHIPMQCVGLLFRTLPGLTMLRITVKVPSWLVRLHRICGTTLRLPLLC